ncbi:MAG: nuclear transport factor 2 family protein [Chloroflexi bacterium]|nr:nuclear transport factor 2 family protein [Chloroflexota bacterium]
MKMARIESAIRVVLAFNEALNRHDVAAMMLLLSDDCIFENTQPTPDGAVYSGKEAISQFWQEFFRASPQAHMEIEEIFGFGVRCVTRWRYDWVDAAGEKGHVRGADLFQVKHGFICEKLSYVKG